jgi:regulator of replication initiation timing
MKKIIFIILILQSNLTFSQSKKAQIEQFKVSIDSLKNVLENERNLNLKKVQELNTVIVNFENQITLLKTEVKDTLNNLNQKQLENDQFKNNLNLNSTEISSLKSTLENEKTSNFKKVQGLNVAIVNFENQISLLKSEVKDATDNQNQKQLENAQLKEDLNLNLAEITDLKIQSLNKEDSIKIITN